MTSDRWRTLEALFEAAAPLAPAERRAFLDAACRRPDGTPDPTLRAQVERLITLDTGADDFLHRLGGQLPPGASGFRRPYRG